MSGSYHIRGPKGVGAENGDLVIETDRGTTIALIYRGFGAQGELVAFRRAEQCVRALTEMRDSCIWCEGVRQDGEQCACTDNRVVQS